MKIAVKVIDGSLPVPQYATAGAVGFDLYNRLPETIGPREVKRLPANIIIRVPKGYMLQIFGRSSTPGKYGLLVTAGIIDQDYCGSEDELKVQVINLTNRKINLPRGTRIAQGILVKVGRADFSKVKAVRAKSRGGFGSTGDTI